MTRALVRLGDKTTSGGEVISASSTIIEERNIALNGDMAWCPQETCNGPFQINGTAYHFAEDKACVATGDRVLCNCKNNQVLGSTTLWVEDSPGDNFEEHRKRAAEWPITKMAAAAAAITAIPVFAKSVLRGTGNTDAGTAEEPQANIGEMSFYQSRPSQPAPEPEQHAQAAKKKKTPPPPETPKKKSLFDKVTGFFFGEAEAMPLLPPPVVMGGSAEAGMAAAAGGATAKANQDAAKALTHTMKHLSGPEVWSGSLAMNLPFVVMGAIVQSKLKGEKSDLLTPEKLLEVAHSKGTVPTRVRYNWITDDETGRLKAVGYHTSTESGRDQVRVRMLEKQMDGSYEFWGDERIDKPLITWTPASTPGSQDSWNTGNNSPQAGTVTIPGLEHPEIQGVTITTTPVPEEKDFRDYILVFPGNIHPPIYIYLSKPPVEFLEVKLFSDFDGRSRQGELEVDHIPSAAAAKAHYKRLHPELSPKELKKLSKRVAAIGVPIGVHRNDSETYGGRNTPEKITAHSYDLRAAADQNFDAVKPALKEHGATDEQLEEARAKLHQINESVGLYQK
ncbi:S-type pyocin domain-containing protein [Enterobacter bugandensis]|uniref:S-type pyocin domain-containing protein n=1 Tax=Enterobacter bugandensis TaxID=881260 RepID=UPI002006041D|nr:S-type pyocin domain-containing protein [Enterobacter bugandensis]MCK6895584.1 S-type pyocin domain-containing protein [Enterobacter bugandensis]